MHIIKVTKFRSLFGSIQPIVCVSCVWTSVRPSVSPSVMLPVIWTAPDRLDYFVMVVKCQLISINVVAVAVSPRLSGRDLIAGRSPIVVYGHRSFDSDKSLAITMDRSTPRKREWEREGERERDGATIELLLMLDLRISLIGLQR